jgi:hypothetical protein
MYYAAGCALGQHNVVVVVVAELVAGNDGARRQSLCWEVQPRPRGKRRAPIRLEHNPRACEFTTACTQANEISESQTVEVSH